MDFVYLLGAALMWGALWAMVMACDTLGVRP